MVSRFACDDHPKGEDDGKKIWIFVFMEASAGIVVAKGKASRAIGIPLTKSGRQRKAGRLLGDLVGTALIAVKVLFAKPSIGSRPRKTRPDLDADLAAWLANRQLPCQHCQGDTFRAGFICDLPERFTQEPLRVIPVVCATCGHTELFSADVVLGN